VGVVVSLPISPPYISSFFVVVIIIHHHHLLPSPSPTLPTKSSLSFRVSSLCTALPVSEIPYSIKVFPLVVCSRSKSFSPLFCLGLCHSNYLE
jgi:hypothetical protein